MSFNGEFAVLSHQAPLGGTKTYCPFENRYLPLNVVVLWPIKFKATVICHMVQIVILSVSLESGCCQSLPVVR